MAAEAAEVLDAWRRAERLLTVLPQDAPERSEVEEQIAALRSLYQHVTGGTIPSSRIRLESTQRQIARARADLDRLSAGYEDEDVEAAGGPAGG